MNKYCSGKVIKKISKFFPDAKSNEDAVKKFFKYYYEECGLSLKEIVDYLLNGTTHSVLSLMAKNYGIESIAGKGGNVFKYDRYIECDCGEKKVLRLLKVNKDKHKNLILKCPRCKVGDMK